MAVLGFLLTVLTSLLPVEPLQVLHDWDARREAAWVAGSPEAVRALYLPGSRAGEYDEQLVRRYRERGLEVQRMRTQVLNAAVLVRRLDRLRIRVTDRVGELVVTRDGEPVRMPRDTARTRVIELRRLAGVWLVAEVSAS